MHFLAQQALTGEEVNRPLWIDSASWARDFRGITTRVHQKYEVDGRVRQPSGEIITCSRVWKVVANCVHAGSSSAAMTGNWWFACTRTLRRGHAFTVALELPRAGEIPSR